MLEGQVLLLLSLSPHLRDTSNTPATPYYVLNATATAAAAMT